jgi:tetratricopeptide (TPR) repeat protein
VIRDGNVIGVVTEVAGQFCTAAPAILVRLTLEGWGVSLQQPPQAAVKEKPVQNAKATELLKTAQLQSENGDFRNAWRLVEQAAEIEPNAEMLRWQAELAMKWLRRLVIKEGETFGAVVDRVQGTLYRGATGDDPSLAADCFAHIGWGNFLKGRDGSQRLEVEGNYRKAVELDPSNSYAHAMWGHWILWKDHERLEEARPHFATALKSGRDREFVRNLQLAALKNARSGNASAEIIRVADEIRRNNEPLGLTERSQIESHVYFMYRNEVLQQLSSILPPSDHLATYQWLIRGLDQIHLRHEFWVARLTEATGNLRQALAEYRSIRTRSQTQGLTMGQELDEAIRRCEAAKH